MSMYFSMTSDPLLARVPDCCYATVPNGDGTYSLKLSFGRPQRAFSFAVRALGMKPCTTNMKCSLPYT